VELHLATAGAVGPLSAGAVERAVPLAGVPGARRLAPTDQVEHVTLHQTVDHPGYRGRLRDLFLLADAYSEPTPAVDTAGWTFPAAAERQVVEVSEMAREIAHSQAVTDRFQEVAATWYLLDHRGPLPIDRRAAQVLNLWTTAFVVEGGATAELWGSSWKERAEGGGLGLRAILRTLARALWLPPLAVAGWWRARGLRQEIERLLPSVDEGR
jgi:hypothetical protein